jgi:hypothetical protein
MTLSTKVGGLGQGYTTSQTPDLLIDGAGALVVIDFFTKAMLDGRGYQVRTGTITTPLVGDVVITDTAAEYCVDTGAAALTVLPVYNNITVRLATGTLHEYAVKSVGAASTAGTAFVPLPLKKGGVGAASTARVQAAGAVTVAAELATTTTRHWEWSNPAAGFTGALPGDQHQEWKPIPNVPVIKGTVATPQCIYVQVAATGTGPSNYAHMDYLEFANALLGASF